MSRLSTCVLGLFLLLTLPIFAAAQETAQPEVDQVRDKQALELLETVAEGISGLRAFENRIYLGGVTADLLWKKDEKRARALFDAVTKEMVAAITAFDPTDQDQSNAFGMIQQQRRETIERMARHDPEMAMAFLRATRQVSPDSRQREHLANETQLELHLAGLIAVNNPAQALRIARASLEKGTPSAVVQLLLQISAKDQSSAHSLHREIIDRLKTENLQRNSEAANTAWNLLTSFQPPQAKEDTYRELLELLTGVVLSAASADVDANTFAQNHYHYVQSLIAQLEKYTPGRVSALRRWRQTAQRRMDPGTRMHDELNDIAQKGTVEDILALAGKHRPDFQMQIYQRAAWKALSAGDANRAREIILEFVTDPIQRQNMLDQIDNQSIWNRVSENKIAEARQMLGRIKSVEQRVQVLITMAQNVSNSGDKKQALDLLGEARTLLYASPMDSNKMMARLQLAQSYSSLDSEQSMALLEPIVAQVNQLVAAAVVLDGFEHRYLKEGEWTKANYSNLGNVINNLGQNLGQLARQNPEGARYLSDRLERLEIRLMAQLEIAQSLLATSASFPPHKGRRFIRFTN